MAEDSYPVYSADDFFEDVHGNYNFDASKLREAHAMCQKNTELAMAKAVKNEYEFEKIFVANTFTRKWEMDVYYELAEKYGFKVYSIIVENRHGSSNMHEVPEEQVQRMKDRFEILL